MRFNIYILRGLLSIDYQISMFSYLDHIYLSLKKSFIVLKWIRNELLLAFNICNYCAGVNH